MDEHEYLEILAEHSLYGFGPVAQADQYLAKVLRQHWRGTRCLELGPADGFLTAHLIKRFDEVTAVDGASQLCRNLRAQYPQIEVIHALFEEYFPAGEFDTIVLGHVLEHVMEPHQLLQRVGSWLASNGVICAAVPNALSLHRQLGVIMGLLAEEHQLNDADRSIGHRRVYDLASFQDEFRAAGLRVIDAGGYLMKLNSNSQQQNAPDIFTESFISAAIELGARYPHLAAEIYVVADREG